MLSENEMKTLKYLYDKRLELYNGMAQSAVKLEELKKELQKVEGAIVSIESGKVF